METQSCYAFSNLLSTSPSVMMKGNCSFQMADGYRVMTNNYYALKYHNCLGNLTKSRECGWYFPGLIKLNEDWHLIFYFVAVTDHLRAILLYYGHKRLWSGLSAERWRVVPFKSMWIGKKLQHSLDYLNSLISVQRMNHFSSVWVVWRGSSSA